MKLDAETLRKLALDGARNRLRTLDAEAEKLRDYIRQLSGASIPGPKKVDPMKPTKPKGPMTLHPGQKSRRKRRAYSDKFRDKVVKEAREADNASAVGKKHNISPSLVRLWMDKAK
jgi:hypothetical protein